MLRYLLSIPALSIATLLLVSTPAAGTAQSLEHGPLLGEIPTSVRAASLGNAFMLTGTDPEMVFYNPALLQRSQGIGMSAQLYSGESTAFSLAGGSSWWGGGIGFGIQVLEYSVASDDTRFVPTSADDLLITGPNGITEFAAVLGYARQYFGFRLGASAKAINRRVDGVQDGVIAVDLGASRVFYGVTFGVAVQNLGENLVMAESELPLAERVTVGLTSSSYSIGGVDVAGTFAVTRRADVEVIPGGGLEFSYWPVQGRTFIGRVGLKKVPSGEESPFTFGAGFRGDAIAIDYGYQTFDGLDGVHRVGLTFR